MVREDGLSNSQVPQVQMLWPRRLAESPPPVPHVANVAVRTARQSDLPAFFSLMAAAGWRDWGEAQLAPWLARLLPEGWVMAFDDRGLLVATSMATHDPTWTVPFCAELGWTAADPNRRGQGLGALVTAVATRRMLECGYRVVHLYTETWRLAALKTYLRLGYVPYLDGDGAEAAWRLICDALPWPFDPSAWREDAQETLTVW